MGFGLFYMPDTVDLVTQWIPTDENSVADALSRHDFKRLANLGFATQASILHRPHPTIPTSTLCQKLLSFCGTVSPSPPKNQHRSELPAPHSSGLANLHGKNGILKSLLGFIYHDSTLHSSMKPSPSFSCHRKQANIAKMSTYTSPASNHPSVLSPPSTIYSNGPRRRPTPHFSLGQLAYLSTAPTFSTELRHSYPKCIKTQRYSQNTTTINVPLPQQLTLATPRTKPDLSVVGRTTLPTSTSTESTDTPTYNVYSPLNATNSTPPSTQPLLLASSPPS